jgi:hypothetical protein
LLPDMKLPPWMNSMTGRSLWIAFGREDIQRQIVRARVRPSGPSNLREVDLGRRPARAAARWALERVASRTPCQALDWLRFAKAPIRRQRRGIGQAEEAADAACCDPFGGAVRICDGSYQQL